MLFFVSQSLPEHGDGIYNPYSEKMVHKIWGSANIQKAELAGAWMERNGKILDNIRPEESIIWVRPGESNLHYPECLWFDCLSSRD